MTAIEAASPSSLSTRRLIDADQVAAKLGMSKRQVFRAADAGTIPTGVKLGRLRRWDEVDLDRFILDGCRPAGRRRYG
ncbi:helix-turn-helix transcriptional regulator [Tautonia rosea]|uniref:helix-turn-helix transcriptional regulator n=1 Tax=Tautonia rosea TaxID=2728037 RepID=UPI001475AC94|nr:helix-turn-helix domain-containing protein [Tautonia rosea]